MAARCEHGVVWFRDCGRCGREQMEPVVDCPKCGKSLKHAEELAFTKGELVAGFKAPDYATVRCRGCQAASRVALLAPPRIGHDVRVRQLTGFDQRDWTADTLERMWRMPSPPEETR